MQCQIMEQDLAHSFSKLNQMCDLIIECTKHLPKTHKYRFNTTIKKCSEVLNEHKSASVSNFVQQQQQQQQSSIPAENDLLSKIDLAVSDLTKLSFDISNQIIKEHNSESKKRSKDKSVINWNGFALSKPLLIQNGTMSIQNRIF